MKILFVNSVYNYGSTGRLVHDLMKHEKEKGNEVLCIYGRHKQKETTDTFYIGSRIGSGFHMIMTRLFGRHGLHSSLATKRLINKIESFNPDVIHLHNLHGYYLNVRMLFNYIKTKDIKIIWTHHDCWSFSGSSAHFDYHGCKNWDEGCVECNNTTEYPKVDLFANQKYNFEWKKESFRGVSDLTVVVVSDWLKNLIGKTFFKDYNIERIYNGIDNEVFRMKEDIIVRKKDKIKLLGVANVWEKRKGFYDFIELSKILPNNYEITLVGLTERQLKIIPGNIKGVIRTSSIDELAEYYRDSDLYLNLSVEETMGLTTVEALSSGTPAIVYDKTAVPEIIDKNTGIIVPSNNFDKLVKTILIFPFSKYPVSKCRKRSLDFTMEKMLTAYHNQYRS